MIKKKLMLLTACLMMLALFAPAVSAADYPDNLQFIAYYEPGKLSIEESPDAGTTYYNPDAVSGLTRTTTRSLSSEDWPQFMHDVKNTGYSPCEYVPSYPSSVTHTTGIDVIGAINPVVFKNDTNHKKILVMTGFAGIEEPDGTTQVNLTCIDWYNGNLNVDWNHPLPRTNQSSGYYSNSWSSAATDGTCAYASSDNKTVCVNILTGVEVWNYTMQYDNCDGSPTVTDDYVFCSDWGDGTANGGNYYCLYKNDGRVKWIFNNTCTREDMKYAQGTPAYDSSEGTEGKVYLTGWGYDGVSNHYGQLYKVDVATGDEDYSCGVIDAQSFCGSVSVDDDYVYVASYRFTGQGKLYQYNKTLSEINSVSIERTDATPSIDPSGRIYISGGFALPGVYHADPAVRRYSTNLNLEWINDYSGAGGWTCSVAIADEDDEGDEPVFAGKENPSGEMGGSYNTTYSLYAHPITNMGSPIWSYTNGGGTAAIAWDEVYTVDHEGDLYIFS